jgi:hypothetical protein
MTEGEWLEWNQDMLAKGYAESSIERVRGGELWVMGLATSVCVM